ncbi:hypothetical protein CC80DRAFT_142547 [Byssothecium circinans]|uniref:Uncharacterized protein n=1 Tax=Byssothecium circinans TaxID=147558 RepID=A0A6A5TMJ4_9PLEO|nr:hypothetical protein CC80DRAFT_142547 [Byssothecium circinans]
MYLRIYLPAFHRLARHLRESVPVMRSLGAWDSCFPIVSARPCPLTSMYLAGGVTEVHRYALGIPRHDISTPQDGYSQQPQPVNSCESGFQTTAQGGGQAQVDRTLAGSCSDRSTTITTTCSCVNEGYAPPLKAVCIRPYRERYSNAASQPVNSSRGRTSGKVAERGRKGWKGHFHILQWSARQSSHSLPFPHR